jgi:hypothetical protein
MGLEGGGQVQVLWGIGGMVVLLAIALGSISPNRRKEVAQFGISSASGRSSQGRSQT